MPTVYETVVAATEDFLRRTESYGQESGKSNATIIKDIRSRIDKGELDLVTTDGTIKSYLSYAASDPDNYIVSGGVKAGYWLSKLARPPVLVPCTDAPLDTGAHEERDLYCVVESWLDVKGFSSKDTSTLKSGGKWGNPDIVGVKITQTLGVTDIETVSCEVKLQVDSWEQFIFEAVSHKRFCNRSWYCYRVEKEGVPLPKWMQDYSERYRVGIVQIVLDDKEIAIIRADRTKATEFVDRVVEKIPALYDHVPLADKARLIERAKIGLTLRFSQ